MNLKCSVLGIILVDYYPVNNIMIHVNLVTQYQNYDYHSIIRIGGVSIDVPQGTVPLYM